MLRSLKKQRIFPYKIWSRKKLSRNNREWQHVKNEKYLIVSYLTQKSQYGLQCDVLVFSWQSCYLLIYWKLELAASKNCSLQQVQYCFLKLYKLFVYHGYLTLNGTGTIMYGYITFSDCVTIVTVDRAQHSQSIDIMSTPSQK